VTDQDKQALGPELAFLLRDRDVPLGPGSPDASLRERIANVVLPTADPEMSRAARSALYLYHDFLDESHTISQDIHTPTGSLLHAIMHRREPDAWNSKYWLRKVGDHPVYRSLTFAAAHFGYANPGPPWDPFAFVDQCERYRGTGTASERLLETLSRVEILAAFEYAYHHAVRG
jgi:hypothetical protein